MNRGDRAPADVVVDQVQHPDAPRRAGYAGVSGGSSRLPTR